ncbi:MAG: NADH:flavin oxidoreductase [Alphaproteobacteria bacterium]|nr:NADH:flavin oxidoreductase [Alphaproteobacteria bacterium]
MARDPRYDILFQPVRIGPVTTKNRFYQVPHCTGMGWVRPRTLAEMRGVKAEGGWGVVNTEYCSIHPTSDDQLHISATLWDDTDVRNHRLMTDKVHAHGALAGCELWYGGARTANIATRMVPMDVASRPNSVGHPFQSRAMDKEDIRNFRRWHLNAALRAKAAEFDVVYVYATHGYLLDNFLDPEVNTRSDEYGGSLENRTRLVREIIQETKEAIGDRCAIAVRFAADAVEDEDGKPVIGERQEMFALMAEMPDLWDINIQDYSLEMGASRFVKEGSLEPYMHWIKSATTKPVVTVGRFTSPDTMARWVKTGLADLIGAARPSIADPYIPKKIEEGRVEDIRECIGCNICYSGDSLSVPIRCTQNPTMGEEWRKGWHPDRIEARGSDSQVLVVGAGPAGLEAARALGARGYRVALAEASRVLGGRVARESTLPGMREYIRVRDWREGQIAKMENVEVFRESRLTAEDIRDFGADHVVIATGARWRKDVYNGQRFEAIAEDATPVFTPDDIMDGNLPEGPVVVYDADGYYMGGVIAERLRQAGLEVTLVTPDNQVSAWAENTGEGWRVPGHLMRLGVELVTAQALSWFDGETVTLSCVHSERERDLPAKGLVVVGQRAPVDELYTALRYDADGNHAELPFTLARIGDAEAPAIVAAATYAGHRYARELDNDVDIDVPMQHDKVDVGLVVPPVWARAAE